MEETLTDCLVRAKENLGNLKRVRNFLETGTETGHCSITWRTIEAFDSILGICSSQHTPQSNALDILLDSFYHLARNNTDPSVWNNFSFELGIICVKMLSAIERSEIFEVLFCKLLTILNVICEHNTNVWKAAARQILNVFINKKLSLSYFERVLKIYLCILRNIDSVALLNFSSQNLHLLRTLSKLVQKVGDYEIQSDLMELVFLHLTNNRQSMTDFFATAENNLFESLQFVDFESDCRTYLNVLNKSRKGLERKVYSVCCHVLYLGGCFVEPPVGTNSLWVDANKETERLSIRCADFESEGNRVIYILFSDILRLQVANEKTNGTKCLTIQTKSLSGLQFDVKNEDICLMIENGEALFQFENFLNEQTRNKRKLQRKVSKTRDSLLIVRNTTDRKEKVQDDAITSSEKNGMDHILPDILNLFEKANHKTTTGTEIFNQVKTSQNSSIPRVETITPPRSQNIALGSQELSPNSFVESLDKHIGRDSPEIPRTFEDSVETIEFMQRIIPKGGHKLFRSPNKVSDGLRTEKPNKFNLIFDDEKENKPRLKTYERKREKAKTSPQMTMILRERKNLRPELENTQSQDYFQYSANVLRKRKPSLPKLKRNAKSKNQKPEVQKSNIENEKDKDKSCCGAELRNSSKKYEQEWRWEKKKGNKNKLDKVKVGCEEKENKSDQRERKLEGQQIQSECHDKQIPRTQPVIKSKSKIEIRQEKKPPKQQQLEKKPSLLDPNGYTYRRWCEPTTSERSNFWLKKLSAVQKSKTDSDNVFNFSEDSDNAPGKAQKKKRKIVHSKGKYKTKKAEQTTLKQVKEILRKASPKGKQMVIFQKTVNSKMHCTKAITKSPEFFSARCYDAEPQQSDHVSKDSSALKSSTRLSKMNKDGNKSSSKESSSESDFYNKEKDEEAFIRNKKRERSIEETSLIKTHIKKKCKTALPPGKFLSVLRHRLQKKKDRDKHQTDEIIRTVNKAFDHLFDHLQRNEVQKMQTYLRTAEETAAVVEADAEGLSLRAKRIQRAMLYFQAGCSISDLCESLEAQFSGVRSVFRDLEEKKNVSSMISRMNDRLMVLIKTEINKSIDSEFTSRRNKFLKCASFFNYEC